MKTYILPILLLAIAVTWQQDETVIPGAYSVDCSPKCCAKNYCMDKMSVEIINNGASTVKQVKLRVVVNDVTNDRVIYNEVHTLKVTVPPNNSRPSAWFKLKHRIIAESMAFDLSIKSVS